MSAPFATDSRPAFTVRGIFQEYPQDGCRPRYADLTLTEADPASGYEAGQVLDVVQHRPAVYVHDADLLAIVGDECGFVIRKWGDDTPDMVEIAEIKVG